MLIPARQTLNDATATNERLGHENLGFLSETHGFMPVERPLLSLPAAYQPWDEYAAALPEMFRTLTLRQRLETMPILSAADLPDRYLLRASAIFSIFAHAYFYAQPEPPPGPIPDSIALPWQEISDRLQRPAPHLSFIDLNVYNWRLLDPNAPDPIRMENLALLIPILGNEDERRFQTVPIEILARFTPAVGAVVRAQEAIVADDPQALKRELVGMIDLLNWLTYDSFMKVNPNAHSPLYVNPVVWGKTVAPLATPYQAVNPPPGPSGTAIPAFQLLDIFFGRFSYTTTVGHETARTRPWFPPHWQAFLTAVEQVSVPEYVAKSGHTVLQGLFQEALDAYASDSGLLGRHRIKTFGFLDLSFKAGRSKTLGGFGGSFADRLWDRMDGELNLARQERYGRSPQTIYHVPVKQVVDIRAEGEKWVRQVVLDISQTGIRYQPGDRCAILPENSDDLVNKTLQTLQARGDEPIQLNADWRDHVPLRDGYQDAKLLSLRTLLKFGRLRPISRPVAKTLYRLSHNQQLWAILEARAEDQWELWDLLQILTEGGFNPKSLWKGAAGSRDDICAVVPPESFRMYSISAVVPDEIHLTVGRLRYQTRETAVSQNDTRYGTCSNFLAHTLTSQHERRLSIRLIHPPRFHLPPDPTRPVVMFAGGTGIAPFRSLMHARLAQPEAGENWLFFGTRTRADLYYREELRQWAVAGKLNLRVACSQDNVQIGSELEISPGERRRIGQEMLQVENARQLWHLLQNQEEGGAGAYFYICGRPGFAKSVLDALKEIIHRFAPVTSKTPRTAYWSLATETLYKMVGEDRLMQEIFTTYAGPQFTQKRTYPASEVVLRNNPDDGYWMILNGRIYDLTEFAHLHAGGEKIIRSYAGMDATAAYQKVLHHVNPEVDAMLGMYEIGAVQRLDFGTAWQVVVSPNGLRFVTLKDVYRAWITFLYSVVEMENALYNDYGIRYEAVTHDESASHLDNSPYKTRQLLQTHQRFVQEYVAQMTGVLLQDLWAITSSLDNEYHSVGWMKGKIAAIQQGEVVSQVAEKVQRLADSLAGQPVVTPEMVEVCKNIETADKWFIIEVKLALHRGIQRFERWESRVAEEAGGELITAVQSIPHLLETYYDLLNRKL